MSLVAPSQPAVRPISIYTIRPKVSSSNTSGSFERICKIVIRKRMMHVLTLSTIFTWVCMNVWSFSPRNGLFHEIFANFLPGHLMLLLLTYVFGVLPSFILLRMLVRKQYSAPSTVMYPTVASRLRSLVTPDIIPFVLAYGLQGWIISFLYAISANAREWDDPRLSIFSPTLRHPYLLNERFVFLTLSNTITGMVYALWSRAAFHPESAWPSYTTRPPHRPNFIPNVTTTLLPTISLASGTSISFSIFYYVFRLRIWRTTLYVLFFLRQYIGSFTRSKYSPLAPGLTFRCFGVNVLSMAIWEFLRVLLEVYSCSPIVMSNLSDNPNATLLSGITSIDPYIKHHAFHELSVLAQTVSGEASARRKALLSDLQTPHVSYIPSNNTQSAGGWAVLLREALLILGRDYQILLRRGAAAPQLKPPTARPAVVVAPISAATAPMTPKSRVTVKPGGSSVFRPSPSTTGQRIANSFSSEGASTSVLTELVDSASRGVNAIPSIFLSENPQHASSSRIAVVPIVEKIPGVDGLVRLKQSASTAFDHVKSLPTSFGVVWGLLGGLIEGRVIKRLPTTLQWRLYGIHWWLFESNVAHVESALRGRKIDLWIIEGLSYLTAHSLEEDAYGIVQRDIPRLIEALLSFSTALEAYAKELETKIAAAHSDLPDDPDARRFLEHQRSKESEAVGELIGPLLAAASTGVKLIVGAFGERLQSFKFSPETSEHLQAVVDIL